MGSKKHNIRVAMIGGYPLNALYIRGGVQAATASLLGGLSQITSLDLHVISFQNPGKAEVEQALTEGFTIHRLPSLPRYERLRCHKTYQVLLNEKLAMINPQVIHAQEAGADALVALRSGIPTVVTLHGIRNEDRKHYTAWSQRLRFLFDSLIVEHQVVRQTRYLIAISAYIKEYFTTQFLRGIQFFSIPNAVDRIFFDLEDLSGKPIVLFAGRVTPLKRVRDLVQAFSKVVQQIPDAQLRIAGDCHQESAYVRTIYEYIQQANLKENVHLLGELSQTYILHEFATCSLLALPSGQENAPMVIGQALAAGKPVVATRVGGVAEMLGTNGERGLLVPVGDLNGLAEAIIKLLKDNSLRRRTGEAGCRFACENYHPDQVAQRTVDAYREIIAREGLSNG